MTDWVRVKNKVTGHQYSVARALRSAEEAVDKPAVGRNGKPLPAKPNTSPPKSAPVQPVVKPDPPKAPAEIKEK
jgi:hypothetical protein